MIRYVPICFLVLFLYFALLLIIYADRIDRRLRPKRYEGVSPIEELLLR